MLNSKTKMIKYKHLEWLCVLLNCQPNDLLEWEASDSMTNIETPPLKDLRHTVSSIDISQLMKSIPIEKMDEIQNMLKEIKGD